MIFVYCRRGSTGAKELVAWLNANGGQAVRVKKNTKIRQEWIRNSSNLWVNWGDGIPPEVPGRWLNRKLYHNKFNELQLMAKAGVSVPEHSRSRPTTSGEWLARLDNHHEANDLLANLSRGDYYVRKYDTVADWRSHVFKGQGIRLGHKVPRIDKPHPLFRSWNAGWKLVYDGTEPPRGLRDAAKKACAALGYDFGAVDLGVTKDGKVVVWEVNAAPGLEGNTIATYGKHILEEARA